MNRSFNITCLVSIIIPCHNYGNFLKETLKNITHQTYKYWECIMVDDGSKDNTKDVAEAFVKADKRFKYIYQENSGVSAARNTGIAKAKGQYIQFIDADDLLSPRKLELHVLFLEENKDIDIVYSYNTFFDTNNPTVYRKFIDLTDREWLPKVSGRGPDVLNALLVNNIMVMHAPLIRKQVVDSVGLFNPVLKGMEDWDYWIRCALNGSFFQFDEREETQVMVRVHPTSASKNNTTMITGEILMRAQLQKLFSKKKEFRQYHVLNKEYLHQRNNISIFEEIYKGKLLPAWKNVLLAAKYTEKPGYYIRNAIYWHLKRFRNQ